MFRGSKSSKRREEKNEKEKEDPVATSTIVEHGSIEAQVSRALVHQSVHRWQDGNNESTAGQLVYFKSHV